MIEGTNHEVSSNDVKNNDIGIQQQGGSPYSKLCPKMMPGMENKDGFSANYFVAEVRTGSMWE
ncbi:MAG: hypothetical protein IPG95_05455 [Saprospiraceae bacterium]|nr:hypothetical protein [Saprospiraceae bacterium]